MKNVDLIIKFLSGDMDQEEAGSFKKDLATNPELKQEYTEVSHAYQLIKTQLRKRDEDSFRAKLAEVMEQPISKTKNISISHWRRWYFLLPLAASLAILISIFLMNPESDIILAKFYKPQKDAVVLALNQATRGASESGIDLYRKGLYEEAMNQMSELLASDEENQVTLLFYLLSSLELDLQEIALEKVLANPINTELQTGQCLIWYTSLALIKSNRFEEAAIQLQPLTKQPGPYQTSASRLLKRF